MSGKGNLRQKIMVEFLSMMLVIGMAVGAVPIEAFAVENTEIVESVSESTTETTEEETVAENETEPETITEEAQRQATTAVPYSYTINADRTAATITKYTGSEAIPTIPSTVEGNIPVTAIGSFAFYGCNSLDSITIPSSVTSIGNCAFDGCSSLETITVPSSVTSIGNCAFARCRNLTSITISDSVTSIGDYTFDGCSSLTSITIPSKVEHIGHRCFDGCSALATVIVKAEDPLTTIGSEIFNGCGRLTTITAPHGTGDAYKKAWSEWKDYIQEEPHTFSADWSWDANNHWYECTCGAKKDEVAHSFGEWTVTKDATTSEKGTKKRSCTVCGYEQTEEIPMKAPEPTSEGKIETDKEQGENAPATDFATPEKDLIGAVLTTEEQDLVKAGTDIKIILDIDNMDASVSQSEKQVVTAKADGYNVGQYLDINLYKIINENKENKEKISQTSGKIRIVIAVPEAVKNTDSKTTRSYAVVRVHDGVADLLADLDNDEATITIETDRFSTYALVYKDSTGSDTKKTDQNLSPATGDDTPIEMCVVFIMLAGLSCLTLFTVNRKNKTEV